MDSDSIEQDLQRMSGAQSKAVIQIDPQTYSYKSQEADRYQLRLDEAIDDAMIATTLNNSPSGRKVVAFFRKHADALVPFYSKLFWLTHMSVYEPHRIDDMQALLPTIGRMWVEFVFPLQASRRNPTLDEFQRLFPFVSTQVFQFTYMALTNVHPSTISKEFQRNVCGCLLNLFTSVDPVDSLIFNTLNSLFLRLPNVDIPDNPPPVDSRSIFLPIEDLSTLVGMQRRVRAAPVRWKASSVSPIIAAGTGQKVVPYDRDSTVSFAYPKGGEEDWKSRLPPLAPPKRIPKRELTRDNYDPSKETRSLILRAKRTNISKRLQEIKATQAKIQDEMDAEYRRRVARAEKVENAVYGADQKELSEFVSGLQGRDMFKKPQRQFDALDNVDLKTLIEKY